MKTKAHILLTGATGYIGRRLLPVLLKQGYRISCCVRDASRFRPPEGDYEVNVVEADFLEESHMQRLPESVDAAYYLIHSMSGSIGNFSEKEARSARNFKSYINRSQAKQIIYLSGLVSSEELSEHLQSRFAVERILASSDCPLTTLRAGIVVGSGSASFEIIRDLVEKLPLMIAPKWVENRCQPIAVRNVMECLTGVLLREDCYESSFDIGTKRPYTYKEMLYQYAEVRGLKRTIISVPVMTPRLSSYWLYFVTSTSYNLAVNLVDSLKVEAICQEHRLTELLGIEVLSYKDAVRLAFDRIEQNEIVSTWKDSLGSSSSHPDLKQFIEVPKYGCFKDVQTERIEDAETAARIWSNITSIGGSRGWYYGDNLWKIRGFLDKLFGGVGLQRGRRNPGQLKAGDPLDFWRVLVCDEEDKRLLLYAEMRLPGEAWLEFKVEEQRVKQIATFRPDGIPGRLYWYAMWPFHLLVFKGMLRNLIRFRESKDH